MGCYDCSEGDDDALDTALDRRIGAVATGLEAARLRDGRGLRADTFGRAVVRGDLPGGPRAADAADPLTPPDLRFGKEFRRNCESAKTGESAKSDRKRRSGQDEPVYSCP